jgi:hypothetical protein
VGLVVESAEWVKEKDGPHVDAHFRPGLEGHDSIIARAFSVNIIGALQYEALDVCLFTRHRTCACTSTHIPPR